MPVSPTEEEPVGVRQDPGVVVELETRGMQAPRPGLGTEEALRGVMVVAWSLGTGCQRKESGW